MMELMLTALNEKRILYTTNLINESLPLSILTSDVLYELSIDEDDYFGIIHLLFDNQLKRNIESKTDTYVAQWKSALDSSILSPFKTSFIKHCYILNLSPYTRTLVYSFKKEAFPFIQPHIKHWFNTIQTALINDGQFIAFANPSLTHFSDIGKLYKSLRQLSAYQYIIGMGHLMFYHDFTFTSEYSITEYKYIQRYEAALTNEFYDDIEGLLVELSTYLKHHQIKDSKVIYIYKELFSITIRYLYTHETDNLELIKTLNTNIDDFPYVFNDLTDVSIYMNSLITLLRKQASLQTDYHPHIKKALKIIHLRYMEDLGLLVVADELNISSAYLSRLFKANMHMTFKSYLTKHRLAIIKNLLTQSSQTITDIAMNVGYNHANQLTRIFKKYEHITPTKYRQLHSSQ